MSATAAVQIQPQGRQKTYRPASGAPTNWPKDLLEAYACYPGPYTIENAETIGIARTLREVLPMLVQARFGSTPPADLSARLTRCDVAQLQTLQAAVTSSSSLEAWVALVPQ